MKRVVVDADAIIAQLIITDVHHPTVLRCIPFLKENLANLIFPTTAIIEAITTIQRKFNEPTKAIKLAQDFELNPHLIKEVAPHNLVTAISVFSDVKSKKNTLFDCTVLAVAKECNADAIFSFDKFYKKMGFKLLSDLL